MSGLSEKAHMLISECESSGVKRNGQLMLDARRALTSYIAALEALADALKKYHRLEFERDDSKREPAIAYAWREVMEALAALDAADAKGAGNE